MKLGTNGRGLLAGFLASVLMLVVSTSTTLVGIWIPLVGSSVASSLGGTRVAAAAPPPRKLAHHPSSEARQRRVAEPVTVLTFFLEANVDKTETIVVDHYRAADDNWIEVAHVRGRSSPSHRRLDHNTDEAASSSSTSSQEADSDAQASKLTRLLIPLVCVAIACLVAASAVLLFVVIVRTRHFNAKTMDSAISVHHVRPVDEPSYPPPSVRHGDIPFNETMATTNEASAGTSGPSPNVSAESFGRANAFGSRLLEAIKCRTRSITTTHPFVTNESPPGTLPPQEVHRPNLLTGIYRQQSLPVAQAADPVVAASFPAPPRPHHHHDAVPLSIVSTMTNSFHNETDDEDVLDMDLDLYLGLAAAAVSSSSRDWGEKGVRSSSQPTDALSAIEEGGDSSSRQLVQEIHWQGSSDALAVAVAAPSDAPDVRLPPSASSRPGTPKPKPKPTQHFVDALYSLVAVGVPPQVIIGSSFDSAGSAGKKGTGQVPTEVVAGSSHLSAAPDLTRKHSRDAHEHRSAARRSGGTGGLETTNVNAAVPLSCRGPHGRRLRPKSVSAPMPAEFEARDDAEDSYAGSSMDGRSDSLLEL